MADVSALTPAQIATLATNGVSRTITTSVTRTVAVKDTSQRFYFADAAATVQGIRLETKNQEFQEDVRLSDISGAGPANALTNAEMATLVALLQKLHVARVHP
jgi:hypothetical protein